MENQFSHGIDTETEYHAIPRYFPENTHPWIQPTAGNRVSMTVLDRLQ